MPRRSSIGYAPTPSVPWSRSLPPSSPAPRLPGAGQEPRSCCAQLLYLKRKQTKQNKKIGYFNTGPGTPPQSYGSLSSPAWPLVMSSLALSGNENGGQYRRQNSNGNSNSLDIPPQVRHGACPPVHHYHTFPGPDLPLLPPCRDPDLPLLHPCLVPLLPLKMFSK